MTIFWIFAAALLVMALAFILPGLLRSKQQDSGIDRREQNIQIARDALLDLDNEFRRGTLDEKEYRQARSELELSLHEDVSVEAEEITRSQKKPALLTAILVTVTVTAGTVFIYQKLGDPNAITLKTASTGPDGSHSVASMIEQLEARMEKNPDDIDGWLMLGRSYMTEENYPKAEEVYSRLLALEPENAEYMLLKADAMAMVAGGQIRGEPEKLILAALERDPDNFTGLWLAGMVARENGDKTTALKHWNKLKGLLPEGSQDLVNLEQLIAQLDGSTPPGIREQIPDIDAMVAKLEDKLEADPQNPTGWFMLGRSYMVMKRYPDAVRAFEEAYKQNPEDPETKLSLADALAMSNQGRMSGRPISLVEEALELSPNNPKALWLAGMAAREANLSEKAIAYWQKLLPLLASDPNSMEEVKTLILQAGGTIPETIVPPSSQQPGSASQVQATVTLSDQLVSQVNPNDLLFVYVKAFNGPPMPLAAARKTVSDLPLEITLNDSMGMMPQLKMSDHDQWTVGARISKSGQPTASSGDLFAETGPVKAGDAVVLRIDQVVP